MSRACISLKGAQVGGKLLVRSSLRGQIALAQSLRLLWQGLDPRLHIQIRLLFATTIVLAAVWAADHGSFNTQHEFHGVSRLALEILHD